MDRWRFARPAWIVIPAVLLFWFLALNSMVGDSPTMDEQNHLARGLAFLQTGDPRLSLEHPPLVNGLSALPVSALLDVHLPLDDVSWTQQPPDWYRFARKVLWEENNDAARMIFLARLPIVFLTLGLALTAFHFAREMWGRPSALPAFLFLLFDPNVLAHGRYVTTDVGGTAFLFLAAFLLWRLWQRGGWSWRRWLWAGVGLGLAFGSKLSMLVFVPIFGAMALLPLYGGAKQTVKGQRALKKGKESAFNRVQSRPIIRLAQFLTAGLLSILVVWAIFGFEWGAFTFGGDGGLVGLNEWRGPMPTFWAGLEQILSISGGGRPSFLLGHFSNKGFWNYFPVAFGVKTPPVLLIALVVAAAVMFWGRVEGRGERKRRAVFLLLPALFYFAFSMQSALNIGYRHLLPMLPFLYVLVSGLATMQGGEWASAQNSRIAHYASRIAHHVSRFTFPILLASLLIADFAIHPHYLSYFNVLAGGPENGRNILIDSNIDWGQDLLRLKTWMDENEVESVKLGWFGTAVPDYYNIHYTPLPGVGIHEFYSLWGSPPFDPTAPEPGVYAISVTSLWELPLEDDKKYVYPWFRARPPDDRIGYSILIYEIAP